MRAKVAAKALGMRKFSGFLPKAATTLERPCESHFDGVLGWHIHCRWRKLRERRAGIEQTAPPECQ